MSMTVEDEAFVHNWMVHAVGWSMGVFYANDGIIGSWDLEWLQGDLTVIIGLF